MKHFIDNYIGESLQKSLTLLTLRLVAAFVFLWHGIPKAIDISFAMEKFVSMGFPGFLGPIIGWMEVIGGIFLILGIYSKWNNFLLGGIVFVAIVGVQISKEVTASLERDLLLLAINIVLFVWGSGKIAITKPNSYHH